MRVAIIGAGPAGLCAAKHATSQGMSCTVFEQGEALGGTWVYTDLVGKDNYGLPIHTSMYTNLRVNIPKEIVHYPGFPHKHSETSYITSKEVLQYLNDYADHCNIRRCIKFCHHVKRVCRKGNGWTVTVVDLPNNQEKVLQFDAIFVCNGLNNKPEYPKLKGMHCFRGKSMHSHDYRQPEPFHGETVLIIGGGPSAMDVTYHVANVAKKVVVAHHSERIRCGKYQSNVFQKPDVTEIKENSAVFEDGSEEKFDTIIYCTGYMSDYPFLDETCGITVEDKYVFPLYKHFINAYHPTMCILGNLSYSMQFPTFDLQVRFFMKSLKCEILPSEERMLKDINDYAQKKMENGCRKKSFFVTTSEEDAAYYAELAEIADIEPVPKVMINIFNKALDTLYHNYPDFRNDIYEIIDSETFTVRCSS